MFRAQVVTYPLTSMKNIVHMRLTQHSKSPVVTVWKLRWAVQVQYILYLPESKNSGQAHTEVKVATFTCVGTINHMLKEQRTWTLHCTSNLFICENLYLYIKK